MGSVEVAIVEGNEHHPQTDATDTRFSLEKTAWGLEPHEVSLPHSVTPGVLDRNLGPHLRRGVLKLRRARCLGARVKVVHRASGGQREWVKVARRFVRRCVLGGLEDGPARGVHGQVLVLGALGPREQVVPVGFAVVGVGGEPPVRIDMRHAFGMLVVARPLDTTAAAEFGVTQPRVVARTPVRTSFPSLENLFGVTPVDKRLPVLVPEVHAASVIEKDVQVGLRLAGRLYGFVRKMDGAVHAGKRSRLLAPDGGGQDHVGVLGGLGHKSILHDDEQLFLC